MLQADKGRCYITTPIYYVNSVPHVGHAYTNVLADAAARVARLMGMEVKFVTGTDEHGQKVERSAKALGKLPSEFVDANSLLFRNLCSCYLVSNDDFIRTTQPRHINCVKGFWDLLKSRDEIYMGKYSGWYCVRDESFYQEHELSPNGLSPTGAPVEWVEEESYFFRLSKWQKSLMEFYAENPDFIVPKHMFGEVISFVKSGLEDLSISRSGFHWGIGVPGDSKHVIYVWLDALVNYISALGYLSDDMDKFWSVASHMVGKDIWRFHAVYWPAFLLAAGLKPPRRLMVHGWWMKDGQKMSKSTGNVVDPFDLVERFGSDAVRYFLLSDMPFGNDGNITYNSLVRKANELADKVGNLVQRVMFFASKHFNSSVPEVSPPLDHPLFAQSCACLEVIKGLVQSMQFNLATSAIMELAAATNRYLDSVAPWKAIKVNSTKAAESIYISLEIIRHLGIYLQPFTPEGAQKILDQLQVEGRIFSSISNCLTPGHKLGQPSIVFRKFDAECSLTL